MKDDIRPLEDPTQVLLNEVQVAKGEATELPRAGEVVLLERSRVVVPEAIDADDVVAVRQQPITKVRPDESRRSGDYRANCLTFLSSRMAGDQASVSAFGRQPAAEIAGRLTRRPAGRCSGR